MGFYGDRIFPAFYDLLMDQEFFEKYRREQLAGVEGEILEIGVGTGLNLPHYPERVKRITTVDPNPGMNKKLRRRIASSGIAVDQKQLPGENLPFESATFDTVVSTLTLCSIAGVEQALGEVYRVLKPGGRFVFFEHGVSPDEKVHKWQRRLNGLEQLIADGCRLDVDVREIVDGQPFATVDVDNFYLEKTPRTHGYIYRGAAVK